jgi:hypothetical protein
LLKSFAAIMTMGAFLFVVAAAAVHADEREKCRQRIAKAEARLEAVTKHGETSKEARERWHELRAEREHCWTSYHNGGVAGTRDGTPSQTGTMMIAGLKNMNTSTSKIL